jgi:hypothetical protein
MVLSRASIGHDSFVKLSPVPKTHHQRAAGTGSKGMRSAHSFGDVRGARQQSRCGRQSLALIELSPFLQERARWPQDIGALVVLEGMDAARPRSA